MDEFHRFSDLPEPLRATIYQKAWRDLAGWRDRKQLRLVCRQACAAVDGAIESITFGRQHETDVAALAACIHAVGSGRFPALLSWSLDASGLRAQLADGVITALAQALSRPLHTLRLNGSCFGQPAAAATLAGAATLPALRAVTLRGTEMGAGAVCTLAQGFGPCLEVLKILYNTFGSVGAVALADIASARLPVLRELDLPGSRLGDDGVRALAQVTWGALEQLNLSSNSIKRNGAAALATAGIARLPALRLLDLGNNQLGNDGVQALMQCSWPRLHKLQLNTNGIDGRAAALVNIAALPQLRELGLGVNCLGDDGMRALAQVAWTVLSSLELQLNHISHAGAAALADASVSQLPALRYLHLGGNVLRDVGVEALARRPWPCLQKLKLDDNIIEGDGATALGAAQTICFPALESLSLASNRLDVAAVHALLQPAPWTALQTLYLEDADVDVHGIAALAAAAGSQLPALRELTLGSRDSFSFSAHGRLGGASIAALAGAKWRQLETLNLLGHLSSYGCRTDDNVDRLEALAAAAPSFPALRILRLSGFKWTEQQLEVLRAAWAGGTSIHIHKY